MAKSIATLDGVPLSGVGAIAWTFQTGFAPFTAVWNVHNTQWERQLKSKIGQPLTLRIRDQRGTETRVQDVYILHVVPSDGPKRTAFLVADRRWKWTYSLVSRDYNIPRKDRRPRRVWRSPDTGA